MAAQHLFYCCRCCCWFVGVSAACDLAERSRTALRTACQHEGFRGIGGCPLTLSMHGGCGGAKLQVGCVTTTVLTWQASAHAHISCIR